jgi:hypothetical protein
VREGVDDPDHIRTHGVGGSVDGTLAALNHVDELDQAQVAEVIRSAETAEEVVPSTEPPEPLNCHGGNRGDRRSVNRIAPDSFGAHPVLIEN